MNIMVTTTPLTNVRGRVDYISNAKRQEHLEAVYSEVDTGFWEELSAHCQKAAKEAGHKKAREAREFMMPLANQLASEMSPKKLCEKISKKVKEITGTENIVAIHWNKTKSNYHCHIIVSENEAEKTIKSGTVLTRNTYYDSDGKRSTKSKCLGSDGELLPGCRFYPKGSCIKTEEQFKAKKNEFATKSFLREFKHQMANFQNELLSEERFKVADPSIYLSHQHIGKGLPEEIENDIKEKNARKSDYNKKVKEILEFGEKIPKNEKKRLIDGLKQNRQVIVKEVDTNKFKSTVNEAVLGIQQLQTQFDEMITEQQQENLGIYNDVDYGDGDELFKMLEDVVYQNKWQQPTQQQNKQRERDYEWEI